MHVLRTGVMEYWSTVNAEFFPPFEPLLHHSSTPVKNRVACKLILVVYNLHILFLKDDLHFLN
jgi:hypothetical protein